MNPAYLIEIATSDFLTTEAAILGGADRVELCANLAEGGTTPSLGLVSVCRMKFPAAVLFPIIRPRGGDFLYNDNEFEIMLKDVELFKRLGCDGIVAGLLNVDGTIDLKRTKALVAAAYPLEFSFHRAFDRCSNPYIATQQIIDLGCQRILTSGQEQTAPEGAALIKDLQEKFGDQIIIMPGSGVRAENIKQLAETTGCFEFHSSLKAKTPSAMQYINPQFDLAESYQNNFIDKAEVGRLRQSLIG